jgi:hypothetical protein
MPSQLIYDEEALVEGQIYKYDQFLHERVNKYTGSGRTLVTLFSIDEMNTTDSLGLNDAYQILGPDSPFRFNKIEKFPLIGMSPLSPENGTVQSTNIRDYNLNGEAFVIPGTVMPKENDFFIVEHLRMTHLIRITEVTQDGLNTDGSYRITYSLYSTNPEDIQRINKQVVGVYRTDLQTIGGEDLTPVIGKEDYELRHRLIRMIDDMVENYVANYYDHKHNCFLLHLNGRTLFDMCGNAFMARNGVVIRDNGHRNIVLTENKLRDRELDFHYQRSPYKWIERDAPLRYLSTFKYRTVKASDYPDSSFANYGDDVDVMIYGDEWCLNPGEDLYFPMEVYNILASECDPRGCNPCDCCCCKCRDNCIRAYKLSRHDYISLIHDYIHGRLRSIRDLSLYTGDQLFDNSMSQQVFLWTPIIIYIIKQTLKIK